MRKNDKFPLVTIVGKSGQFILKNSRASACNIIKKTLEKKSKSKIRIKAYGHVVVATDIFQVIFSKTIDYNKFEASIPISIFLNGDPENLIPPVRAKRKEDFYRVRKKMVSLGLIRITGDVYRINLPGFLKSILDDFGVVDDPESRLEKLRGIRQSIIKYWQEKKWEVDELGGNLDDNVSETFSKSRAHRKKRKEKQDEKPMKGGWIQDFMRRKCEEYGVPYFDTWTVKDKGCAANWIKYCEAENVNPREVLAEVCRRWAAIQFCIKDSRGNTVPLKASPNFPEFFKYRREIGTWLATAGEKQIIKTGEVISLDDFREGSSGNR